MILYYEGLTKKGEKIKGTFTGTKDELTLYLRKQNIFLLQVKEHKRKLKKGRYGIGEFTFDIEQLAYFVGSGMSIDKAVNTLIKNSTKQASVDFWSSVLQKLKEGKQFSVALKEASSENRLSLSELYINIISVGEEVGDLKSSLRKVSEYLHFRSNLMKEVWSALAYPLFILFVSIVALFFIATVILPKFSSIFTGKEMHYLPFISRVVIGMGKFINSNLNLVLGLFFSLITGLVVLFAFEETRRFIKDALYKIPGVKEIVFQLEFANMCSSLGAMLEGGVEIGRAVRLAQRVVDNKALKHVLEETAEEIKKGLKISDIWKRYDIIPESIVSLVSVGENSASLGEILTKLGERYSEDFKHSVSRVLSLLEPVLIIFLGIIVGIVVVAIMLAVISLNNAVS